ncbi:Ulp1-like peptidase [Cucumis melo var. makuwa]|uniref:Ulp1-like peptidase n=1 Tax=Cucumis melo var. makuwa TaxID=1194695 RepID=A0A5D3DDL9_CUCMM|nr:Ulp1-like peptidase [Cucumis melo var. makuwa]
MKRRKLCKIANKKVSDQDQQNSPITSTEIISEPTIPVPDVEIIDTGINKPHCIVWQRHFDTHLLTADNKKAYWKDTTAHLNVWTEEDLEYYFNTVVGDFKEKPGWGDVNYVIGCIKIKEHWLAVAANMRKCKIYVFDSMPNYVDKKLVDQAFEMPPQCIASLAITIGVDLHSKRFKYGPWPVLRMPPNLHFKNVPSTEIIVAAPVDERRGVSSHRVGPYTFPIRRSEPKPHRPVARHRKANPQPSSSAAPTRHPPPAFCRSSPSRLCQPPSNNSRQVVHRSLSRRPSFTSDFSCPDPYLSLQNQTRHAPSTREPDPRLQLFHTSSCSCTRVKLRRQLPAARASLEAAHEEAEPPPAEHAREPCAFLRAKFSTSSRVTNHF